MFENTRNLRGAIIAVLLITIGIGLAADQSLVSGERIQQWFDEKVIANIDIKDNVKPTTTSQTTVVVEEESQTIRVVESASPSVVSVVERSVTFDLFSGPQLREASIGTGFAVESDTIVTNRHVVSDPSATYMIVDNNGNQYDVVEIVRDSLNDLAILKLEDADLPVLEFGDSEEVKIGQTAIAIGNALGRLSNTVTRGVISGKGRGIVAGGAFSQFQEELEDLLQTDAALNPGNSGGPLLNLSGQVIGVNVAISAGSENIGFAIPSMRVIDLLNDYNAGVDRRRPFLGVRYNIITEEFARSSEFPEGALIRAIVPDSPADDIDLQVNDVIISFGGVEISEESLLSDLILDREVGDSVEVDIWRNGNTFTQNVTLEPAE